MSKLSRRRALNLLSSTSTASQTRLRSGSGADPRTATIHPVCVCKSVAMEKYCPWHTFICLSRILVDDGVSTSFWTRFNFVYSCCCCCYGFFLPLQMFVWGHPLCFGTYLWRLVSIRTKQCAKEKKVSLSTHPIARTQDSQRKIVVSYCECLFPIAAASRLERMVVISGTATPGYLANGTNLHLLCVFVCVVYCPVQQFGTLWAST